MSEVKEAQLTPLRGDPTHVLNMDGIGFELLRNGAAIRMTHNQLDELMALSKAVAPERAMFW